MRPGIAQRALLQMKSSSFPPPSAKPSQFIPAMIMRVLHRQSCVNVLRDRLIILMINKIMYIKNKYMLKTLQH